MKAVLGTTSTLINQCNEFRARADLDLAGWDWAKVFMAEMKSQTDSLQQRERDHDPFCARFRAALLRPKDMAILKKDSEYAKQMLEYVAVVEPLLGSLQLLVDKVNRMSSASGGSPSAVKKQRTKENLPA